LCNLLIQSPALSPNNSILTHSFTHLFNCFLSTLIHSLIRTEYKAAGLYSSLWWSTDDYFGFQQSAISEVRMMVNCKNIAVKAAKRLLYQPNEELSDDYDEELPLMTDNIGNDGEDDCVPSVPNITKGIDTVSSVTITASTSDSNNEINDEDTYFVGEELGDEINIDHEIPSDICSTQSEQSEDTTALNKKLSRVSSLECIDTSKLKRTLAQSTSYMNLSNNNEESITSYDCLCLCVPLPQGSNIIFDRKKRHMASAFAPFHGPIIVLLLIVVALLLVDKIF